MGVCRIPKIVHEKNSGGIKDTKPKHIRAQWTQELKFTVIRTVFLGLHIIELLINSLRT